MQQRTAPAIDRIVRYPHFQAVAAVQCSERGTRNLLEGVILFLAVCMLWGLVIATAVAGTMH
jgi:hypothetical protein